MCHLPFCGELRRCHVSYGGVDPPGVVVCKGFCDGLFCLLIVGKLPGPDVLFLEGLVEGLDVAVLLWCVLPDELVPADA